MRIKRTFGVLLAIAVAVVLGAPASAGATPPGRNPQWSAVPTSPTQPPGMPVEFFPEPGTTVPDGTPAASTRTGPSQAGSTLDGARAGPCVGAGRPSLTNPPPVTGLGWLGLGAALAVSGLGGFALARRGPGRRPPQNERTRVAQLARERAVLVHACMEVSDRLVSDALKEQLRDALTEAGVMPIEVTAGERFDSARHRAVGRVATRQRALHNHVAGVERDGFSDGGRRLRCPDVVVFNANGETRR